MGGADTADGSADCFYQNVHDWSEANQTLPTEVLQSDYANAYRVPDENPERLQDEQLEHMARLADQRRSERRTSFLSSGLHSSAAHCNSPAVSSTVPSSVSSLRFARAQAVGAPPRGRSAHTRRQRSQWYKAFTGETLESKGNLAAQQKAFDAVARAWRSHRDRRSLGASPWDGHVTSGAEQRMNDL